MATASRIWSYPLFVALAFACVAGPKELETPAGYVRLDTCGECPNPYVCYLNPLVDLRRQPNSDSRQADVFSCSKPDTSGLNAVIAQLYPPSPGRSCPATDQRYWNRNGKRFICCLFASPVSVACHAE